MDKNSTHQLVPRRALRGKRGGLKDLPEMPDDILFEVFVLLHPKDLLNSARTTRPLRAFLMTRRSAFIWRASRTQVDGLPDCPQHLSEPAYANLMFFSHCHKCLKGNNNSALWEFAARYCQRCRKTTTIDERDFSIDISTAVGEVPPSKIFATIRYSQSRRRFYHVPQLLGFMDAWNAVSQDEQAYQSLIDKESEKTRQLTDHAAACRKWQYDQTKLRAEKLDEIRRERCKAIMSRLREEGWGDELGGMWTFRRSPVRELVWIPRPLTDQGWRKIRSALHNFMQEKRDMRLRMERRCTISSRINTLDRIANQLLSTSPWTAPSAYGLLPHDLPFISGIQELVKAPTTDLITEERFLALKDEVTSHLMDWHETAECELERLLPISCEQGVDALALAVVSYKCRKCAQILYYPFVLAHLCLRTEAEDSDVRWNVFLDGQASPPPWSCANLDFSPNFEEVRELVRLCDKDPDTTTTLDMEELDERFAYSFNGNVVVVTWRAALEMLVSREMNASALAIRLATDYEKRFARNEEAKRENCLDELAKEKPFWCCSLCPPGKDNLGTRINALGHVNFRHGSNKESRTVYLHLSGGPIILRSVLVPRIFLCSSDIHPARRSSLDLPPVTVLIHTSTFNAIQASQSPFGYTMELSKAHNFDFLARTL
ncbi:uncharacterized protein LAESUDRAFT_723975 [Laetiporus sulphureus 93-53]|uniref:F-box domain-containing protein n=1 Tax=Laetiporus sulphureus 93-53 TaxID=1314785 RepID=A0A165F5V8_9APHY|nr:uncharacterized protein LAESUDRAFT_723975 [Laetiporus sulphureus 93-53]KZT08450.1 hypothetical protein LAESUDRAFT_723975 [Laetiporus sulphureus 93-53]